MTLRPTLTNGPAFAGMTIGLLGGSFNPAHEGHLEMSLHALRHLQLDQIWWLVSPLNPLKSSKDMALADVRRRSAREMARHPRLVVTDIESDLGTRYTADTLRALKKRFPQARFVWLMGADNLRQIPRWRDWKDIFRAVPVAVFRRPAYPAGRGLGKAAQAFDAFWRAASQGGTLAKAKPPAWIILDNKLNDSSSTNIRKDNPSWHL